MAWEAVCEQASSSLSACLSPPPPHLTHQAPATMGLPSAPLALQAPLTSGLCPEHPSCVPPTCLLLIQILAQIPLSQQALP